MKDATVKSAFACETCGKITEKRRKPGGRIYAQQKYCSPECRHQMIKRRALTKFEAGDYSPNAPEGSKYYLGEPELETDSQEEKERKSREALD
jgi:hypothetical protein